MSELYRFAVADGSDIEQLIVGLQQRLNLPRDRPEFFRRRILDTFDWRLHAAGSVLEHRTRAEGPDELVWSSSTTGEVLGRVESVHVPRMVADIPPGPVRDRLASVLEMRALLDLVDIESVRTTLRLVDDECKTTARLVVDRSSSAGIDLPVVVEVVPLRGYAKQADSLIELLSAQVVLSVGATDPLHVALARTGSVPGSYSSKLSLQLDVDSSACDAWTEVFRALTATMDANLAGVIDDTDSEFLHDYRVAVRRCRSVLSQARGIYPSGVLDRFRRDFAHLGAVTGPTRDLDVYLLTLPDLAQALPAARRDDLEPLAKLLDRRQSQAHTALVAELTSSRCTDAMREWKAWLEDPEMPRARGDGLDIEPDAGRPAHDVAAQRIWRAYRKLVKAGRSIDVNSHAEELHSMRKDAKRLRYLFECFSSLFPGDELKPIVKELKGLQDVLGEFQDSEVQAETLESFAHVMLDEADGSASTLMSMGYLVEHLDRRRDGARDAFASSFARFDAKHVRRAVRELFAQESATVSKRVQHHDRGGHGEMVEVRR